VTIPIADGPGSSIDQGVTTFLFIGALLFGWVGYWRLRRRGFHWLPRWLAWGSAALSIAAVVLALVLPPIIRPNVAIRPASSAKLAIVSPRPGEVFQGTEANPAKILVRLRLTGARIVPFTSTRLRPDEGHIHLTIDGRLVSMTYGLEQEVESIPGNHLLAAEFVAVDHGPFAPRVIAEVSFVVSA
jgi:hypothetical protein